ncbi:MAG: bifunctional tetrahydrofolate synthase/dihydrofolate synthase [Gammaproteobacteria bacterium]|nr:bifunctional tetrahydrofolate synthase/dihydrofolate synthase [Gammaproteobacteria bacterium]
MRFNSLPAWLNWQEQLHPSDIELGLARVKEVAARLRLLSPKSQVITVAGTNGKGSSVAMLERILSTAGYSVGVYSSPHFLRYNERIRINEREASDAQICAAFAAIDTARAEVSLTYFEFATLAALWLFSEAKLDVWVLEVGLGGRLDAVNILDADCALLTSVALDHQDWLGCDRESIGLEKAGVFRAEKPAVCADVEPPKSVLAYATELECELLCVDQDYSFEFQENDWNWQGSNVALMGLPKPALQGVFQLANAAAVVQVLQTFSATLPIPRSALDEGLQSVRLQGRLQRLNGEIETYLDVAHNPAAATVLAAELAALPHEGKTTAVLGMLDDKDVAGVITALQAEVDHWVVTSLPSPRGLSAERLAERIKSVDGQAKVTLVKNVVAGYDIAVASAQSRDRIVVLGSFLTVAALLRAELK